MILTILQDSAEVGRAAAERTASVITSAVSMRGKARIIAATGNSQLHFAEALTQMGDIPWSAVEMFHHDEYVGLRADHPASFRLWIRTRLVEKVRPAVVHYIEGDAPDLNAELQSYAEKLNAAPIDVAFVGIGENGHIAFNDPPVADFRDPLTIKRVVLDDACRQQQAGEGHFPTAADVPREAVTLTCSALLRVPNWVCSVPDLRKAQAVRAALQGPVSEACPASIIREHPGAALYLDRESASMLSLQTIEQFRPVQA